MDYNQFGEWLRRYLATGGASPEATPAFRGMTTPGNIDLNKRPVVHNPDGTISTVRSASFGFGGRTPYYLGGARPEETLLPTVAADGSGILSDRGAVDQYRNTGQHLGKFETPEDASAYAVLLHNYQADQYGGKGGQ